MSNNNVPMNDLVSELSSSFLKMFSEKQTELNKNVVKVQEKNGMIEMPIIAVQDTSVTINEQNVGAFSLKDASKVTITSVDKIHPKEIVVRLSVSYADACRAYNDFNFRSILFGKIFSLGSANIVRARGWGYNVIQYGNFAFTFNRPGSENVVFRDNIDGDLEIRFYSNTII